MKVEGSITRRGFLLVAGALAAAVVIAVSPVRSTLLERITNSRRPLLRRDYPMGRLSARESETIADLIRVLVEGDHAFLMDHVDWRTSTKPGYLREYQNGVKLLDEAAGRTLGGERSFSKLDHPEQVRVVESILRRYGAKDRWKPTLERMFVSKRRLAFREFIVRDILNVYYRSAAGWAVVGYTKYPGVPAKDPLAYTLPVES